MGLTGLVVLEGANATGKSSLAEELRRRFDAVVMHQTYRFRDRIFDYHTAVLHRALELSKTRLVVLDRLWMSEEVYAHVYRQGTPWPHQGRFVERVLRKAGAVTIVCVAYDDDALRARYLSTRSHRSDAEVEKNLQVNRRFRELSAQHQASKNPPERKTYFDDLISKVTISATQQWPEHLFYEIGESYNDIVYEMVDGLMLFQGDQLRGALDNPNFLGSANSEFLIVGDRANAKHRWFWPFYEYGNCSLWLANQLHVINFNESSAAWTNAYDNPNTIEQLQANGFLSNMKVIALGNQALKRLESLKVKVHAVVPHPQHGRRFTNNGDEYRQKLQAAFH
jgi:nicotinamide riboside kinase